MKVNLKQIANCVSAQEIEALKTEMINANELLHTGKGVGNDFLGWVHLPSQINEQNIEEIHNCAIQLAKTTEVVVVVGIGGSYLGAKAVMDACMGSFDYMSKGSFPHIVFAGQNLSEDYIFELMQALRGKQIGAIVISKSGTTTEPAVAFRIIKKEIEERYGKSEAAKRIVAVTDQKRGALRTLATQEGYKTFVIPDDVGGRFSVLTPVGLLPLAVAGVDIEALVKGAQEMETQCGTHVPFEANPAMVYAAARTALYRKGKKIEILASYEPKLANIGEWWKQLYGESEGKQGKGLFPASVTLTADLHSMGQYIQDGERSLFETVINVENSQYKVEIQPNEDNLDGLNFIAGKRLSQVNHMAQLGTVIAHVDGEVPNVEISIERINAHNIGKLIYFFEKACGISGYALNVNPFDQPGVEAYKANMFALLKKPGYEKQSEEILKRINDK